MKGLLANYYSAKKEKKRGIDETGDEKQSDEPNQDDGHVTKKQQTTIITTSSSTSSAPVPLSSKEVALVFQGNEGFANSITHYYHFLFGVLFPIIEYHVNNKHRALGYYIATDVGPMKRLLCDLPLNITGISGPATTKSRNGSRNDRNYTCLPAYDSFQQQIYTDPYTTKITKPTIQQVLNYLDQTIPTYIRETKVYDILLIERTNEEKYYREVETDERHQRSGATLRSISNHHEIASRLKAMFNRPGEKEIVGNVSLERASLYYQYHLFRNAKVVIAQHGAALSNIIFMVPSHSVVIEINPKAQVVAQFQESARSHFRNLAKHIGLPLHTIEQKHDHSVVDCDEIVQITQDAYEECVKKVS